MFPKWYYPLGRASKSVGRSKWSILGRKFFQVEQGHRATPNRIMGNSSLSGLRLVFVVASALLIAAAPLPVLAQNVVTRGPSQPEMADRVRQEFLHAWNGYKQYAWGHDELQPLTKTPHDWYGTSLYMTPVDALDTMILMGLNKEADEDRELSPGISPSTRTSTSRTSRSRFACLGACSAAINFRATSGCSCLRKTWVIGSCRSSIRRRACRTWKSTSRPARCAANLRTQLRSVLCCSNSALSANSPANPIYYDKAKRALVELYNRRSTIGLVGDGINITDGEVDRHGQQRQRRDRFVLRVFAEDFDSVRR